MGVQFPTVTDIQIHEKKWKMGADLLSGPYTVGEDRLDVPDFHIKGEGEVLKEHNILGLGEGKLDLLVKVCNKCRVLKVIDRHE